MIVPGDVPHDEGEGVLGGGAEVGALDGAHDVGVAVDEAHEALQAPQAALDIQATQLEESTDADEPNRKQGCVKSRTC